MFVLTPAPTFTCPVELSVAGESKVATIQVTFKYLTPAQYGKWILPKDKTNYDALLEVVSNWSGVTDADGNEIAFDKNRLKELCTNYHRAGFEMSQAFVLELKGARQKN